MWFGCFRGLGFRYSLGPVKSYLATIVFHVGQWVLQSSRTLQSWQIPCSRLPPTEKAAESSRNRPALPPLRFRSFLRLQASSAVPTCFIPCLPSASVGLLAFRTSLQRRQPESGSDMTSCRSCYARYGRRTEFCRQGHICMEPASRKLKAARVMSTLC